MKKLLILLLATTFITGCSTSDTMDDTSETPLKEEVEEEKEEDEEKEAKVFIQEGPQEISIRSENIEISKLSLISLEYDIEKEDLVEGEILKEKENIQEDNKITWDVVYSEGIPSMKLLWELPNGSKDEYIIFYDGKDGLKEEEFMVYPERKDLQNKNDAYISELVRFSKEEVQAHHENLPGGPNPRAKKVYEKLMLPGIHENTVNYQGRVNPDDQIEFIFPDAEKMEDRTSYIPEISEEGYFTIDLAGYEFKAGEDILVSITGNYPEAQIFKLTVNEAKAGMEYIGLKK